MSLSLLLVLTVIVFLIVLKSVVVVPEGSVLLIFKIGSFQKAYGAGLQFGWFDLAQKIWVKVGTIGMLTSEKTMELQRNQIPIKLLEMAPIGSWVRVSQIEGTTSVVTADGIPQVHRVVCERRIYTVFPWAFVVVVMEMLFLCGNTTGEAG